MSKIWFVTGASRGLGRDIVENLLSHGETVVATARDPGALDDLAAAHGDNVLPVRVDVTDATSIKAAVEAAMARFGRIDVLVNNAGYGEVAPFEQMDPAEFRAQMETNFFGVVEVARAVLPVMRTQQSGFIMQVSSVGGRVGTPGLSAYQSAKWAVGGFTEVLARELEPLGIRITTLEPGGMRTGWGQRARGNRQPVMADYQASVGALNDMLAQYVGNETGDPARVAEVIYRLADHPAPPLHLLLGSDATRYAGEVDALRARTGDAWKAVSESTDYTSGQIPAFPESVG
jgi:NAD(P)-dependent dehydrogenase (short-subunit alcohol dehydrogenase family)